MEEVNLSPYAQVLTSSPFCSSSTSNDAVQGSVCNPQVGSESVLQKLSSNLESLITPDVDSVFNDALIYVGGRAVPVHRCILAARCPFFRALFSKDEAQLESLSPERTKEEPSKLIRIDLQRLLDQFIKAGTAGYEAFLAVLGFFYSGRLTIPAVTCIDDQCLHDACRPVVEFAVEMLCLSSVFDIPELKTLWQHLLLNIVEKAQVDDILPVLIAAQIHGAMPLQSLCMQLVAVSNIDIVDIEKQLPLELAEEAISLRVKLGLLQPETMNPMHEKQCQRIRKALDSDDVELVQLLLKEGRICLDGANALHYAASYCDPHTVQDILELGLADPNLRNNRGYTVLHVASMRRDPIILVALLSKGASPLELTPDGRTALQLCRRLTRRIDHHNNVEAGEEAQRDRLFIEILDQAGKKKPFADAPFPPAVGEKELFMRLLYLENRVALARLLFPTEAKIIVGISHLEATSEFTGLGSSQLASLKRAAGVDLNQTPLNQISPNQLPVVGSSPATPIMTETLLKRVQALQKTVELAKQIFPRYSSIVNSFMDDDLSELSCIEKGSPEEQKTKKRRYVELKQVLEEAFREDMAAMDRHKSDSSDMQLSSSSSSSSKHR